MLGLTAENIGTIILGFSIAIITLLGGQKGKQIAQGRPGKSEDVLEVAGAIVSDKSVERMVKSLDAFTAAAALMTHSIDKDVAAKAKLTEALDRCSKICGDMLETLEKVDDRLERVKDELIRSSR